MILSVPQKDRIMIRTEKRKHIFLTLLLTATVLTGCAERKPTLEQVLKKTAEYEQETVTSPSSDSLGGEWTVIPLARSGETVSDDYFKKYTENLIKKLKEQDGILSDYKYTEYSRATLAVRAVGENPEDIGGYNIEKPLEDFDTVILQGLNGAVFALLALNADGKNIYGDLEQKYLQYILSQEKKSGGFSLDNNSEQGDTDMTAMTLQSLEPYKEENNVRDTIDKGIQFLADAQVSDGGYMSYGEKSSESTSQTIIALSTYGIDCNRDSRFIKEGKGLYDTLMEYYQKDGGFSHTLDGEVNPMATDQAFCALVSYERFKNDQNSLYNMTD